MTDAPPEIRGTGYSVEALEAALWAVGGAADFRDAILRAANLGDDADTTAAIARSTGRCPLGRVRALLGWDRPDLDGRRLPARRRRTRRRRRPRRHRSPPLDHPQGRPARAADPPQIDVVRECAARRRAD